MSAGAWSDMSAGAIRGARPSDARAIARIYEPVVRDTAWSFETEPPAEDEMRRRIRSTLETMPWLVCEADGCVVGYGYGAPFHARGAYRWTVELSVYVAAGARGRGVGRSIATSLLSCLKTLGYVNAVAAIALPNRASVGLFESLGFRSVGVHQGVGYKLGRWHDVGRWELSLAPRSGDPRPPAPFTGL
jgi:L-amino acid N-acyltransferase YncA